MKRYMTFWNSDNNVEFFDHTYEFIEDASSMTSWIDWKELKAYYPDIIDNVWNTGDYKSPVNKVAKDLERFKQYNPYTMDYTKIRRRVEDALRKTDRKEKIIECALTLNVKLV